MSTATDRARAKAERLTAAHRPREVDTPELPEPPRAARVKPMRMTLDLAPALHAEFEDWTIHVGRDLAGTVNKADVLRILMRRLLSDEALQADVTEALRVELRR